MEPKHLTKSEFDHAMYQWNEFFAEAKGSLIGIIVYKESNWEQKYPLESRSYRVSSESKHYKSNMISKSLFGSALDGTDNGVRLDYYDWEVDYCFFPNYQTENKYKNL